MIVMLEFRLLSLLFFVASLGFVSAGYLQDEEPSVTSKQKQELKRITRLVDKAAKQYKASRFDDTAETIKEAKEKLFELAKEPTPELLKLVQPEYDRLEQAYKLLNDQGEDLGELEALPRPAMKEGEISFVNTIAPILVDNCGRCHVDRATGGFGMPNYQALVDGPGVAPGRPEVSRIIELIEEGSMPPQGSVDDEDLETLKTWIKAGAEFDGEDVAAGLRSMVQMNTQSNASQIEVAEPTGKETVSFSLEIAPLFVESCSGCHIDAQNARGGLNMTNFRALLNGGDNGPMIKPGEGDESLLVQKLRGMGGGQRMPLGRPAFSDEQIEKVVKWINEGARFDGRSPRMNITQVAALARAESMTHEQLSADRSSSAKSTWKLVMSDIEANQFESDEFLLMGSVKEDRLQEINQLAESLVDDVKSELQIEKAAPLVKGRMTIYVFERRYDYSEFGKMVESRDLPSHFDSHWGYDTINAYSAILTNPRKDFDTKASRAKMAQQIAATAMRDQAVDVPKWFADGVGFVVAKKMFSRDEATRSWQEDAEAAAANMNRPDDFIQNRIPEDNAGLVSYLFVSSLMKKRGTFNKLLKELQDGSTFDESFNKNFGSSPAEMINAFYGTSNRQRNNRRNPRRRN